MGYISTGIGDHFTALLVSLMALQLAPVGRNPLRSCCYQTTQHYEASELCFNDFSAKRTYSGIFSDSMALLVSDGLSFSQVNSLHLLAFVEFLHQNGQLSDNIANYLAVIRAKFIMYGLETQFIRDDRIQLFSDILATFLIKWSKILQQRRESCTIAMPFLGSLSICPVTALNAMLLLIPGQANKPLFQICKPLF